MTTLNDLVGESSVMVALRLRVQRLLQRLSGLRRLPPILIQGETGTGKTLLARLIHRSSARSDGPFVDVNCAAIPETMLESELFGHERFAFTDAKQAKTGLFQAANGGVLFLDEIGLMSMALQPKLLKVLDEGAVRRLGSTRNEQVNVSIVTATNEDLRISVREKRFREDLYSRIAVLSLEVPPLRAREGDVELLAERFLARACEDYGIPLKTLGADARAALRAHAWPENVRELRNMMERVALEVDTNDVTAWALGLHAQVSWVGIGTDRETEEHAGERLIEVLKQTNWNITRSAALLGITRKTVRARIERFGLRPPREILQPTPADPFALTVAPQIPVVFIPKPPVQPATSSMERSGWPPTPPFPTAAGPMPLVLPAGLRWERRRVTLLRAQVVSDSGVPFTAVTRLLDGLVERVRSFGGRVEDVSARGVIAAFGLEPDEDAPRRAANAGLAIAKTFEHERVDGALPQGVSIGVAIHVARLLVADVAGVATIDGDAKMGVWPILGELATASGGGVAVSETAAMFLGRQFEVLRQTDGGHVSFQLVGRMPAGRMLMSTEFVGRQVELSLLRDLLERAKEGRGQLVSIIGDPGIGKSRLVREFVHDLAPDAVSVLTGQCVSYGATAPYYLVLDVLRDMCGIRETDRVDSIEAKAHGVLDRIGVGAAAWVPYVLNLLHPGTHGATTEVTPETLRERTFEALQQLVLAEQERRPIVLTIEDLHWIDRTSEELLAAFADIVARMRVLVVCTSRPAHQFPWAGRSHASQIALAPLPLAASRRLVESLPAERAVKPEIVAAILERAEGNPFFLEELMRTLRDEDDPAELRVPETVHDVLVTRVLRLADVDRRILQTSAVIGRDVPLALLEGVCDLSREVMFASVSKLQSAEFLHPKRLGPDAVSEFNHALTWEVVYDSVPADERRVLHARVGEAIEGRHSDPQGDSIRQLAYHALRAEQWSRALRYLKRAGLWAIDQGANREAVAYFEQCLGVVSHLPEAPETVAQAIDLRFDLRNALQPLGDLGRIVGCLQEAERLAGQLGDERRLGWVASYLTEHYRMLGMPDLAADAGRRALESGERLGDVAMRVVTNLPLGLLYRTLGDYRRAITFLRWNTENLDGDLLYQRFGLFGHPSVFSRAFIAMCLAELGEFAEAGVIGREAVTLAGAFEQPSNRVYAYIGAGVVSLRKGDWSAALAVLEECVAIARSANIPVGFVYGASFLGYVLACSGRVSEGVGILEEAIEQSERMKLISGHSLGLACLGEAYLLSGQVDRAAATAERALALALEYRERGNEAYARRLAAELAAACDDVAAAEARYLESLAVAEELGMRPLSAHCHWGLGRALRQLGQHAAATAHMSTAASLFSQLGMLYWRDRLNEDREWLR